MVHYGNGSDPSVKSRVRGKLLIAPESSAAASGFYFHLFVQNRTQSLFLICAFYQQDPKLLNNGGVAALLTNTHSRIVFMLDTVTMVTMCGSFLLMREGIGEAWLS